MSRVIRGRAKAIPEPEVEIPQVEEKPKVEKPKAKKKTKVKES